MMRRVYCGMAILAMRFRAILALTTASRSAETAARRTHHGGQVGETPMPQNTPPSRNDDLG